MRNAFKYQLKVSDAVEQHLTNTLDICRELANAAIQERRDAYRVAHRSVNYLEQANQLPEIKKVRLDVAGVHSQVLQDVLKRVDRSFENFFRRVKQGLKAEKVLSVRWHRCPHCRVELSRDHNAAKNILARGIELLLAGGLPVTTPGGLALAGLLKGEPSHAESSTGSLGN
jgi:transposase